MKRPPQPFCDLYRYVPKGGESKGIERLARFVATAAINANWHAAFTLRLSQWCHWLYLWPLSFLFQRILLHAYGIDIPPSTEIGRGLWMPHARNIVIHRRSVVGDHATIFHNVTIGGRDYNGYPLLGRGVLVGVASSVLGAIRVGDGARIGAHSLVIDDVPVGETVVGIPARMVHGGKGSIPE